MKPVSKKYAVIASLPIPLKVLPLTFFCLVLGLTSLSARADSRIASRVKTSRPSDRQLMRTRVLYNLIYSQYASGKSRFSHHAERETMLRSTLRAGQPAPKFRQPNNRSRRMEAFQRQAQKRIREVKPNLRRGVRSMEEATAIFHHMEAMRLGFGFPDAFCYDRAHVMALELERMGIRSQKVLVHGSGRKQVKSESIPVLTGNGDIWAPTSNHPYGWVIWQTHIAPAIKVRGMRELIVLDPSVAKGPVTASRWQQMMNAPATAKRFVFPGHQYNKEDKASGWSVRTLARTLKSLILPGHQQNKEDKASGWSIRTLARTLENIENNRIMEKHRVSVLGKLRRIKAEDK